MSPASPFPDTIIVTDSDLERLRPILAHHRERANDAAETLETELERATIVTQGQVPADVVTMNSDVVYEDVATGARRSVRLVYPRDADASRGYLSILAPIGSALLGLRVGQDIQWAVPNGRRRLRIVELPYQPEANGDWAL